MNSSPLRSLWLSALLLALLTACAGTPPALLDEGNESPLPPATATQVVESLSTATAPLPTETPTPDPAQYSLWIDAPLPEDYLAVLYLALEGDEAWRVAQPGETSDAQLRWAEPGGETELLRRSVVPVVPFATVQDDIGEEALRARWQSGGEPLLASESAAGVLTALWGAPSSGVTVTTAEEIQTELEATSGAVGLVTFDQLHPRLKVLSLDEVNLLGNRLEPAVWPLQAVLQVEGEQAPAVAEALRAQIDPAHLPPTDRDPQKMTTLIMTGVTAMSRDTAAVMEREGYDYPALVIADVLSAADITHVSNEVPFLDDCVVNATLNNLQLCSHTNYWATLEAIGTDIVGLSGNHVNDFGYEGAFESLTWYRENNIPIYGSGFNEEEACAPLMWEHNGNTFAFIAALAFEPSYAWATDELPGACYYYNNKDEILATVERLSQEVDIVSVELQHIETYEPYPVDLQVAEFREVRAAGADIVTGVQSHVPQAMEPYGVTDAGGPGIIAYGLGNLFFDQMFSWETRSELMARHTIYDGRLVSTEILTAALENYAQPRWTTPEERADILTRIFDAAPPRP